MSGSLRLGLLCVRWGATHAAGTAGDMGSLEFEPDIGAAFPDPPAARFCVHDPEPVTNAGLNISTCESRALVDHVDEQAILVKLDVKLNPPAAMHDRVGHQLGDKQLGRIALGSVELRGNPFGQPCPRDTGRLTRARQFELCPGGHRTV